MAVSIGMVPRHQGRFKLRSTVSGAAEGQHALQEAAQESHKRTFTGVMGYADPRTSVPGNLVARTFFTWTKAPLQEGTRRVRGQMT